jgi:hypothetical protein
MPQSLREVGITLAVLGFLTGAYAALKWFQASRVNIDLGYTLPGSPAPGTFRRMGVELQRFSEPVDGGLRQMNEMSATWEAMAQSSKLNRTAAIWTAVSVFLSTASAVFSSLA